MKKYLFPVFVMAIIIAGSCNNDYSPKPRGYYRIDFPEREYRLFDSTFPYIFEYPVYATIMPDTSRMAEPYWINIHYKGFNAQLHISYKPISKNLQGFLEDSRTLVNKHIPKANSISQREYLDPANHVYGLTFVIKGTEAASPFQFFLTDSTRNFVRGALYFDLVPNNDSLAPVIDFLEKDMEHMISTFRWKKI
jgi:gliding motility-associated lipoprotein GldD